MAVTEVNAVGDVTCNTTETVAANNDDTHDLATYTTTNTVTDANRVAPVNAGNVNADTAPMVTPMVLLGATASVAVVLQY